MGHSTGMTVALVYAWRPNKSQIASSNQTVGVEGKNRDWFGQLGPLRPLPIVDWYQPTMAKHRSSCSQSCKHMLSLLQHTLHWHTTVILIPTVLSVSIDVCNLFQHDNHWDWLQCGDCRLSPFVFCFSLNCERWWCETRQGENYLQNCLTSAR